MATPRDQIHLRLDPDTLEEIRHRADRLDITTTTWIRRAIRHAIEHHGNDQEPPAVRIPWSALL